MLTWLTIRASGLLLVGDADDLATELGEHPCVQTDGGPEAYPSGGFQVAGAGAHLPASKLALQGALWEEVEEYGDVRLDRCRAFMPVPGPLQTVQRAEFWGACGPAGLLPWAFGHR